MRIYLVLLIVYFKLVMTQEFGEDLWTILSGDANFDNNHNKDGFDYSLEYDSGYKQRQQYQSNKINVDIPKDSKELHYVFLHKGHPRYMAMNENERPSVSHHSSYNINGRDATMGWSFEDQSRNNYNNKKQRNLRKPRTFDRQPPDCRQQRGSTYRPKQIQQNTYAEFYDYDVRNDVHNFPQTQKNYKNILNKGVTHGDNCNQKNIKNIKTRFQTNEARRKENTSRNHGRKPIRAKVYANNVANIQKNTIHVGTLAQNLMLFAEKREENTQIEQLGSGTIAPQGTTPEPGAEEILGKSLPEPNQPTNSETNEPTTTNPPATIEPLTNPPILGKPTPNKLANTAQAYLNILHSGILKVSALSDADIQALEKLYKFEMNSQLDKVAGTSTTSTEPLPLTDSPIYNIKILDPNKKPKTRKPKLPPQVPKPLSTEPTLSSGVTEVPMNSIERDTTQNVLQKTEKTEDNVEVTSETTLTQEPSTSTANIDNNENSLSADIEESEKMTEPAINDMENGQTLVDNQDLKPSEDKIFEYVAKMDENALKLENPPKQIKHMEPIAYETLSMEPKVNEKPKNKKMTKRYLSKPKRNVQLRALDSNRPPRPNKKKSTTTTTTTAPELNKHKLQFRDGKGDDYKGYQNPTKKPYKRINDKITEKPQVHRAYSKPTKKNYKNFHNKLAEETQDSQVLGSSSNFFTNDEEDPCQEHKLETDDEVNINADEPIDDEYEIKQEQSDEFGNHRQELHIAELNNMGEDCDDSNEVSYDGDQYIQNIDSVTPAPFQTFTDLCAH